MALAERPHRAAIADEPHRASAPSREARARAATSTAPGTARSALADRARRAMIYAALLRTQPLRHVARERGRSLRQARDTARRDRRLRLLGGDRRRGARAARVAARRSRNDARARARRGEGQRRARSRRRRARVGLRGRRPPAGHARRVRAHDRAGARRALRAAGPAPLDATAAAAREPRRARGRLAGGCRRAAATGTLRLMVRHVLDGSIEVDTKVPLPPGVTLGAPTAGVAQVQGVLTVRQSVHADAAP